MKFDGEISVRAPRETVFEKLRDARAFASCVEGVSALSEVDGTHYAATLETKIAYMRFKFAVAVEVSLAGKLGSMGQPVLRSKAREMEKSFAVNLRRLLEPQPAEPVS